MPPVFKISSKEISIRRWQFFGLRTLDVKISVSRVASVRTIDGIFWGGLIIETYGGAAGDLAIGGLNKDDARKTAKLIEQIASLNSSSPDR